MIVDVGVAIAGHVIIGRHVVVGDAGFRQHGADAEFAFVAIRRHALLDDISAEARAILNAENAADGAGDRAERAANDGADRAGIVIALRGAAFGALNGALRLGRERNCQCGESAVAPK